MKHLFTAARLLVSSLLVACGTTPHLSDTGDTGDTNGIGERPVNVLMVSLDDLNDWVGCLGGHPQA